LTRPRKFNNGGGLGRTSALIQGGGDWPSAKHDRFIIDDESLTDGRFKDKVMYPIIDGQPKACGLVPRDWAKHPPKMFGALPSTIKVIPKSEWSERIKEQDREESSLWHIRMRSGPGGGKIPSLDQNGQGYCWMYSVTMAIMMARAKMNLPYVRLSAHAGAWLVKGGKDEGGWCGLGAQHCRDKGQPSVELWPEKSMNGRQYNTAETWANAALHKVAEDYADLTRPVYDHNMTFDQMATCFLLNQPVPQDYDEWGHSICGLRLREPEAGSFTREIINSWTDSWGKEGCAELRTSWTIDGAIAVLTTIASLS
jgi:hypothetical protein